MLIERSASCVLFCCLSPLTFLPLYSIRVAVFSITPHLKLALCGWLCVCNLPTSPSHLDVPSAVDYVVQKGVLCSGGYGLWTLIPRRGICRDLGRIVWGANECKPSAGVFAGCQADSVGKESVNSSVLCLPTLNTQPVRTRV